MYGITVARAVHDIAEGESLTTANLVHATDDVQSRQTSEPWLAPDLGPFREAQFQGFIRDDGRVGTRNYWIVIPMVFPEWGKFNVEFQWRENNENIGHR